MTEAFYLLLMGGLVGATSSLLGLGGGFMIVPLLPLITGIDHREAIATSLMTILFISSTNSYFFHKQSLVKWKLALALGSSTAIGSYFLCPLEPIYFHFFISSWSFWC